MDSGVSIIYFYNMSLENGIKNSTVESTLAKYLEFRVFELFRNQLIPTISPHCRQNSKEDIYEHLFLCPSQASKKRNFQLRGVLSPFVCLWRTSLLTWNNPFYGNYGKTVLPRDFAYIKKDGTSAYERGFLYDVRFDMELFSSSYYKSFRDRVNEDLLDFDRLRYFNIDVKELLTDSQKLDTRIEVMLKDMKPTDNIGEDNQNRSFDLNATYTVAMTVPYCRNEGYLKGIQVYLNENLVYMHDGDDEIVPGVGKDK